jgi:hypothetical protein
MHMESLDFWRYAVGLGAALALLAGCGGSPPIRAPGAVPLSLKVNRVGRRFA